MYVSTEQRSNDPEVEIDLALAAELQAALLPGACPPASPHQRVAARNRMCGSVGGDFYDFIPVNDEQVALVIGDVVGHGVQASLLMARIMGLLRSDVHRASRPREIILQLNELLLDLGDRTGSVLPCSLFYAVIDAPTGVSFFINAGHPMPFLCRRPECAGLHLGPRNMLLGVERFEPREGCHTFSPGERLVLYTDGILDAVNRDGERFDEARLRRVVGECLHDPPDRCADAVFAAVADFRDGARQSDDETVLVVDRI